MKKIKVSSISMNEGFNQFNNPSADCPLCYIIDKVVTTLQYHSIFNIYETGCKVHFMLCKNNTEMIINLTRTDIQFFSVYLSTFP